MTASNNLSIWTGSTLFTVFACHVSTSVPYETLTCSADYGFTHQTTFNTSVSDFKKMKAAVKSEISGQCIQYKNRLLTSSGRASSD